MYFIYSNMRRKIFGYQSISLKNGKKILQSSTELSIEELQLEYIIPVQKAIQSFSDKWKESSEFLDN